MCWIGQVQGHWKGPRGLRTKYKVQRFPEFSGTPEIEGFKQNSGAEVMRGLSPEGTQSDGQSPSWSQGQDLRE